MDWPSLSWSWEQLLVLLVIGAACSAIYSGWQRLPRMLKGLSLALLLPCLLAVVIWTPTSASLAQRRTPQKTTDQGYVSSDTCRACHPSQYASWHKSYHRTMTQVATPESIQALRQSVRLEGGGRFFEVHFEEDTMWADDVAQWPAYRYIMEHGTRLPVDFPRVRGPVVMTTGSHHMQLYWIADKQNQLYQLSWTWLTRDQRWVPGETVYLQPPITGAAGYSGTWVGSCIKCHSTGGQPRAALGGQPPLPSDPRVGELGIACESCHGPAADHVRANRNVLRRYFYHLSGEHDPTIVNPAELDSRVAAEACARCHSGHKHLDWDLNTGEAFRPGDRIRDFFSMRQYDKVFPEFRLDYFWGDGTSRVTGREYTGMIESGCFVRGEISCDSCHSMHESDPNDQLAVERDGDEACLQCHSQLADRVEEHTHHPSTSSGSRCYNCHMPNTTYGLLSVTRSHRIDIPSAVENVRTGKPNACNLCHVDRTLTWADEHLADWYGGATSEFTEEEREVPAAALWLLKGDAVQRAVAAWHMGWDPALEASGRIWQPQLLARTLDDPYAAVRYLAERSLRKFPGHVDFAYDFTQPGADQAEFVQAALVRARTGLDPGSDAFSTALVERLRAERDNSPRFIRE